MWSAVAFGVILNAAVCGAFVAPTMPAGFAARRPGHHAMKSRVHMVATPPIVPPGSSPSSAPQPNDPLYQGTTNIDRQLLVRIDNEWLDLSRWRQAHPAGTHWIDLYKNQDATEVMYGFHSDKGMGMLKHLPRAKMPPQGVPDVSQATMNFRKWRKQLSDDGCLTKTFTLISWFEPEPLGEAFNLISWALTFTAGVMLAQFHASIPMQFAAVTVLGIANTIAGWLSHDYTHGRSAFHSFMRPFGYFCGGMSTTWWSDKHNKHHARTNEVMVDEDIATDPLLYLWAPDPKNDVVWRKAQGWYFPLPMSMLFLLWRFDSIKIAVERKLWNEVFGLACHYAFVLSFVSVPTFIGALIASGFMTAIITTVTHQGEELFFDGAPDFVEAQYRSTRDARCTNPFSEWLWGGMQYQLEHHLFPTMPRYKYPRIQAEVAKFGAENNLEYRITDEWELVKMNIDLYRDVALRPPQPGAKASRPSSGNKDLGSILVSSATKQ